MCSATIQKEVNILIMLGFVLCGGLSLIFLNTALIKLNNDYLTLGIFYLYITINLLYLSVKMKKDEVGPEVDR